MTSSGKHSVLALYLDPKASDAFRNELLADFRALGFRLAGKNSNASARLRNLVPGIPVVFVPDETMDSVNGQLISHYASLLRERPEVKGIDHRQQDKLLG